MIMVLVMDCIASKPELIADAAQNPSTWGLYIQEGELLDQDPPSWQTLSRAEEILIRVGDWRARKRLLAYASRRLRQERLTRVERDR
jgi:hypothetical protein